MSLLQNLTPLAVVPQNDRLQRFSIVSHNEKTSPGTGKLVVAENIRQEEVARRIVACVNACDGVRTETLERVPLNLSTKEMVERIEAAEVQHDKLQSAFHARGLSIDNLLHIQGRMSTLNDQLLAALEQTVAAWEKGDDVFGGIQVAKAAIAAAKGGAA